MKIIIELERDYKNIDEAILKNMTAMDWAIKNCPIEVFPAMVDNKYIIKTILEQYKLCNEEKR